MSGDYLCNDWDEAIISEGRWSRVSATAEKTGVISLVTEDTYGQGDVCIDVTLEQLERLVRWARATKEVLG